MRLINAMNFKKAAITALSVVMVVGAGVSFAGKEKQDCRSKIDGLQAVADCSYKKSKYMCIRAKYVFKERGLGYRITNAAPCHWDESSYSCYSNKSEVCVARGHD